jgi:CheY-like chemotaxis protein
LLDLALLDVSLRGENSFEIARALAAKSVPFIFMTGYVSNDFPEDFKDRPILNKPVDEAKLVSSVKGILAGSL